MSLPAPCECLPNPPFCGRRMTTPAPFRLLLLMHPPRHHVHACPPAAHVGFAAVAAVSRWLAPALLPPLGLESLFEIASRQRGLGLSPAAAGDFQIETLHAPAWPGNAEPLRASARRHRKEMLKGSCGGRSSVARSPTPPRATPFHYVWLAPRFAIVSV